MKAPGTGASWGGGGLRQLHALGSQQGAPSKVLLGLCAGSWTQAPPPAQFGQPDCVLLEVPDGTV